MFEQRVFNSDRLKFEPLRYYTNANVIVDELLGRRGITKIQENQLKQAETKLDLVIAKRKKYRLTSDLELEHLKKRRKILQMEMMHVFSVICRYHYAAKDENMT